MKLDDIPVPDNMTGALLVAIMPTGTAGTVHYAVRNCGREQLTVHEIVRALRGAADSLAEVPTTT